MLAEETIASADRRPFGSLGLPPVEVVVESFLSSGWPFSGSGWTADSSPPLGLTSNRGNSQKNNTRKRVMGLGALGWRGKSDEGPVKGQEINFFPLTDLYV